MWFGRGSNDFARRWHCARGPTIIQPCKSPSRKFPGGGCGFWVLRFAANNLRWLEDGRPRRFGCVHIYILNGYLYTGTVVKTYRDRAHISGFSGSASIVSKNRKVLFFRQPCRRTGRIYVSLGWELIIRITIGVRRSDVYK